MPANNRRVYILATLDTKGPEAEWVRKGLRARGVATDLVDVGTSGEPGVDADVSRAELFAAGGVDVAALAVAADRGAAVASAAEAAANWMRMAHARGTVAGVIGLGGSAGTTIGTSAMRALPLGVPKVMVSTLASGQVRHYVRDKDIFMLNSVVDIAGLNRISRMILAHAVAAMAGLVLMAEAETDHDRRPLVATTMFGVTTPCVEQARRLLEANGYEVLVFHATGVGGQTMESLIDEGLFAGVLDLTTTELADEIVGGVLSAGPDRLTAAARRRVPQVVAPGATDMVNFHARETVPERFRGRVFYRHNANVTLMRTTAEESAQIGRDIGRKLSAGQSPVCVMVPTQGFSAIDRQGQPFDDPAARAALVQGLRGAGGGIEIREMDLHINDPEFAQAAARRLLELMAVDRLDLPAADVGPIA